MRECSYKDVIEGCPGSSCQNFDCVQAHNDCERRYQLFLASQQNQTEEEKRQFEPIQTRSRTAANASAGMDIDLGRGAGDDRSL